jgi:hypothetical protein
MVKIAKFCVSFLHWFILHLLWIKWSLSLSIVNMYRYRVVLKLVNILMEFIIIFYIFQVQITRETWWVYNEKENCPYICILSCVYFYIVLLQLFPLSLLMLIKVNLEVQSFMLSVWFLKQEAPPLDTLITSNACAKLFYY